MAWQPLGVDTVTGAIAGKAVSWLAQQLNSPTTTLGSVLNNVYLSAIDRGNHKGKQAPDSITGVTSIGQSLMTTATALAARTAISAAATSDLATFLRVRGPWATDTNYLKFDVVTSAGGTFYALQDHKSANPAPTATSAYWQAIGTTSTVTGTTYVPNYDNVLAGTTITLIAPFPAARPTTSTNVSFLLKSNAGTVTPDWVINQVDTHIAQDATG